MTQTQRDKVLDHVANYAREEVALTFAEGKKSIDFHTARANKEWKIIEDLLRVDAWEIKCP